METHHKAMAKNSKQLIKMGKKLMEKCKNEHDEYQDCLLKKTLLRYRFELWHYTTLTPLIFLSMIGSLVSVSPFVASSSSSYYSWVTSNYTFASVSSTSFFLCFVSYSKIII